MKKVTLLVTMLAIWALGAASARAQDEIVQKGFVNIDAGAQPQRQTITATNSFPLYDETANITVTQRIRNGGVFDVSGGMRIGHNLTAGAGYSQFGRAGTGVVSASVPSPRAYNSPLIVTSDASNLDHTERAINGRITWFVPMTNSIDVSVSGGPSVIHVTQGLATGVTVAPGTQSISLGTETQSGNAFGINAGVDGNMMLVPGFGAGVWIRYTYGKLDLPDVKGLKVGGFQGGLGFRARF
ncbi:MAG TPA: hypothetical protein VF456_12890 [Vicinamibacterales bacterium]